MQEEGLEIGRLWSDEEEVGYVTAPKVGELWTKIRPCGLDDNSVYIDGTESNDEPWDKVVIKRVIHPHPMLFSSVTITYLSMLGTLDMAGLPWFRKHYTLMEESNGIHTEGAERVES